MASGAGYICLASCAQNPTVPTANATQAALALPTDPGWKARFSDVTLEAGITFRHNNGAFGANLYPEQMGSGAAFFDYDSDGDPDLFFVQARNWTSAELSAYQNGSYRQHHAKHGFNLPPNLPPKRTTGALYRNDGRGHFQDISRGSGLDEELYGFGVAAGDYNNDGHPDLYVTAWNGNRLFRGDGRGHFLDVTQKMGVRGGGLSSSAAWLDYDRDGKLDLFVGRYVRWTPKGETFELWGEHGKRASGPLAYEGQSSLLFHNVGGRFEEVSARAGIVQHAVEGGKRKTIGKALGVAVLDFDADGWPDIMVANDLQRNFLFRNKRDGTFSEVGLRSGVALGESGAVRAGMGVDAGDIDQSGQDSIVVGNFAYETMGLYRGTGRGAFRDVAGTAGIKTPSYAFLTFGCGFVDVNNDGWLDIFAANGHVDDHTTNANAKQRPLLFLNAARLPVQFHETSLSGGTALSKAVFGRGLCFADTDLDGDVDILMTTRGDIPTLFRNDGGNANNALRLELRGTRSNHSAIGAQIEARVGNATLHRRVRSGSTYLSQSELPITLGLRSAKAVSSLLIRWPSGQVTRVGKTNANQTVTIVEGRGVVRRQPLNRS